MTSSRHDKAAPVKSRTRKDRFGPDTSKPPSKSHDDSDEEHDKHYGLGGNISDGDESDSYRDPDSEFNINPPDRKPANNVQESSIEKTQIYGIGISELSSFEDSRIGVSKRVSVGVTKKKSLNTSKPSIHESDEEKSGDGDLEPGPGLDEGFSVNQSGRSKSLRES